MIISNIISNKISERLNRIGVIDTKHYEAYRFSIELTLDFILYHGIILLIGIVLGRWQLSLIYISTLSIVKMFAGGAHARSQLMCSIISFTVFFLCLFMGPSINLPGLICVIFELLLSAGIIFLAPVEHPNKRFSKNRKNKIRKILLIYLAAIHIISTILYFTDLLPLVNMIVLCLLIVLLNQVIGLYLYRKELLHAPEHSCLR